MSTPGPKASKGSASKGPRITIDSAGSATSSAASEHTGVTHKRRPRKTSASSSRSYRQHNRAKSSSGHKSENQTDPRQMGSELRSTFAGYTESFRTWLDGLFPGHGNAAFFALIGFVVALVFITIGFVRTLVVIALVVAGLAFGQQLDGNPKILRALKRLFNSNRRR